MGGAAIERTQRPDAGRVIANKVNSAVADVPTSNPETGVSALVTGSGASQKSTADQTFQSIPEEGATHLRPGVLLRVEPGSSVELAQGRAKASLLGAGSYKVKGDSEGLVEVQSGKASVGGPRGSSCQEA